MSETDREKEIRRMLERLFHQERGRLAGRRVVLFGSRARGTASPRSDFDIGILGEKPLPLHDFFALEESLERLPTLYHLELVDFCRTDEDFRKSAMETAEVLYESARPGE